jgi:ribonuclease Z
MPLKPSIVLLGTGAPRPDVARGATALLIEAGDDAILIDAGRGVVRQLAALGVDLARVDPMLITHHHYDPSANSALTSSASSWLMGRSRTLRLFGPPEARRIVEALPSGLRQGHRIPRPRSGQRPWQPVATTDIFAGPVCEAPAGASPPRAWTTATGSAFRMRSASAGSVSATGSSAPTA